MVISLLSQLPGPRLNQSEDRKRMADDWSSGSFIFSSLPQNAVALNLFFSNLKLYTTNQEKK